MECLSHTCASLQNTKYMYALTIGHETLHLWNIPTVTPHEKGFCFKHRKESKESNFDQDCRMSKVFHKIDYKCNLLIIRIKNNWVNKWKYQNLGN